jgi:hypothetical protein
MELMARELSSEAMLRGRVQLLSPTVILRLVHFVFSLLSKFNLLSYVSLLFWNRATKFSDR